MHIQQLYTGCLSEAAYYIESDGEAAIIDPLRDIAPYLELAKERGTVIKYIFETHFHADFVSGHIDLAKATGATIIYGPLTEAGFTFHLAKDGEVFHIGKVEVEVLHTPGHTMESSCYLLKDEQGKNHAIFSGDTLFIGDVGRPDLAQKSEELTREDLAAMLYDSLYKKIMPLEDDVILYPAHGAGSSCGKNLGTETISTIGEQKKLNYALKQPSKEAFINAVTEGLQAPPVYFPINAKINKQGYDEIDLVMQKGLQSLTIEKFKSKMEDDNTILLDTRPASLFTEQFVPGSINIGLDGRFAEWAGMLLSFDKNILLVCENNKENESVTRLARVGFQNFIGFLKGGIEAWKKAGEEIDLIINVDADELAMDLPFDANIVVVDVRKEPEFNEGHVKGAVNIPLENLIDPASMSNIEDKDNLYIHCAGGYRSVIAASLMKREGIHNLYNVNGGFNKIKETDKIKVEKSVSALN